MHLFFIRFDKSPKVRRRTAKRQDLLFGDMELPEQVNATYFEILITT